MAEDGTKSPGGTTGVAHRPAATREEKLAAALRDNLLKRKRQQRARGGRDGDGEFVKD
jgi:hypothetical protein